MNIVNEGDVIRGVPVHAVAVEGEGDGVQHPVDRAHHSLAVLTSRAVGDGQTARDEVILDINNDDRTPGLHDLKQQQLAELMAAVVVVVVGPFMIQLS